MLKYLLPEQMDFELKELSKDTLVGIIQIENDLLLNSHVSSYQVLGAVMRYGHWECKGATIGNLKDFLENNFSMLLEVKNTDDRKFDFIISANDFRKAKVTLENEYGLIIKEENN